MFMITGTQMYVVMTCCQNRRDLESHGMINYTLNNKQLYHRAAGFECSQRHISMCLTFPVTLPRRGEARPTGPSRVVQLPTS